MAASHHHIAARIAVDEARLVPLRGHLTKQFKFNGRQFAEVVGLHGDAVHLTLVGDCRCYLEHVTRRTAVTALIVAAQILVHDDTAPVHARHSIADEGVERQFNTLVLGMIRVKENIL